MSEDYSKAKKRGDRDFRNAVLCGEYPYLRALDDEMPADAAVHAVHLGIMDIPLSQIAGTKTDARRSVFAHTFLPIAGSDTEFARKWSALYQSQSEEGLRDPVTVYEYKHRFYVQEGNKRVSVMKYLEAPSIQADVTRILTDGDDPLYEEFLQYYACTKMYEPYLSAPGDYRKLASLLGQSPEMPWDSDVIRRLRTLLYVFRRAYRETFRDNAVIAADDAFLIYLSVYDADSLRKTDSRKLAARLMRMRKEFLPQESGTAVVGEPSAAQDKPIAIRKILPFLPGERPLRIAFLYDADPQKSARIFEHELGRVILQNRLKEKVQTVRYTDCTEEALKKAAAENDVLIGVCPAQYDLFYRYAVRFPAKKFLLCSSAAGKGALRTYDIRMYEAKYLLGMLAAVCSDTHRIAYLSEMPGAGTAAKINAFALGVQMIDPAAEVVLECSDTLDPGWKEQMKKLGISVFSGTELPDFENDSPEFGIFRLDRDTAVNLAFPLIHWGNYYIQLIQSILDASWNKNDGRDVQYLWGIRAGVLDLQISGSVPYPARRLIRVMKEAMKTDLLHPFAGELHSQSRIVRDADAPAVKEEEILSMKWLNENIIGSLPDGKDA